MIGTSNFVAATRWVGIVVVVFVAIGYSPTRADAGSGAVRPCADGSKVFQPLWAAPSSEQNRWALTASCPSKILFQAPESSVPSSTASSWEFPSKSYPMAPITAVEFDLSGGDGSDSGTSQQIRVCGALGCGPPVSPRGPNQTEETHHRLSSLSGHVPTNATKLVVSGSCQAEAGCQRGTPMVIRNLRVEFEDSESPTLRITSDMPWGAPRDLLLTGWNGWQGALRFLASDTQSGIHLIKAKVGTRWWTLDQLGCGSGALEYIPVPCRRTIKAQHVVGDFGFDANAGLQQGANEIEVYSQDAAGNRSESVKTSFRVDTQAPEVHGLDVVGLPRSGWTSSRFVDLAWQGGEEELETDVHSGLWRVQIYASSADSGGVTVLQEDTESPLDKTFSGLELPTSGSWDLYVTAVDAAGNSGLSNHVIVGYDPVTPAKVRLSPTPPLGAIDLIAGRQIEWASPSNLAEVKSGICGYATRIDRNPLTDPGTYPNLPKSANSQELPAILFHGTSFFHIRAISCSGVAGVVAHAALVVDSEPPTISVSDPDPSGWYSARNAPSVSASDGSDEPVKVSVSVKGIAAREGIGQIDDVDLPDGVSLVTVTAVDSSGNSSTLATKLRSDKTRPTVSIDRPGPDQPALLRAVAVDPASGVRDVVIFVRPIGGTWNQLAGSTRSPSTQPQTLEATAQVPDQALPAGAYEIRASATDRAGNVSSSETWIDGSAALIELPMRATPVMTAGFRAWRTVRQCKTKGKKNCRTERVRSDTETVESVRVKHGRSDQIVGQLVDGSGSPLAGAELYVYGIVLGQSRRRVGETTTDADGKFSYTPDKGPSRRVIFRFAGSPRHLPVETAVRLLVESKISLSASARKVRAKKPVTFTGRLFADGASLPRSGLPIKLQYYSRGQWLPFPIETTVAESGRFTLSWNFGSTSKRLKYKIRAVAPWVDGWPYETGTSNVVTVVVG